MANIISPQTFEKIVTEMAQKIPAEETYEIPQKQRYSTDDIEKVLSYVKRHIRNNQKREFEVNSDFNMYDRRPEKIIHTNLAIQNLEESIKENYFEHHY
ncbi:MAG: hypothetical protein QW625_00955 [Candidatus Nanoarchaeia archaeon]